MKASRRTARLIILAGALMSATAAVGAGAPAAPARFAPAGSPAPAELEAFMDGVVGQAMARDHIAGAAVSVVRNGAVALKKGYGFASLDPYRPVDPDRTLFRIGSISKTFTWIVVLRQVEAGRMRLDAPINLYLPEALRIPDQGYKQPIRVRDLMNHTPGFEDRALGQLFERDYRRVRPLEVYLRQERPRRVREPEALVSYSNYGAALAGAAVAEVTGKPFETLVETDITGPLGLARTTFREPHPLARDRPAPIAPALAAEMSEGYRWTADGWRRRPFEYIGQIAPAGAASSTAGDMARYMLMLLGGGALGGVRVYGQAAAAAFASPLPRPAPGVPAFRHGLMEERLPGGLTGVGHDGATLSFFSSMVLVPELNLGVFVSTNTDSGAALAGALAARIVREFDAPPPGSPPRGSTALLADRAAFEAVYLTDRRAYGGLESFVDRLIGAARVRVTEDGRLVVADREGARRFSPIGLPAAGRFVADDGVGALVFQLAHGQARRFFAPSGATAFERVGYLGQTGALILLTALTALASLAAVADLAARARRDFRESSTQRRAGLVQTTQAVLWLIAMGLFGAWATGVGDPATVVYGWPGLLLVLASSCALLAAMMAALTPVFLPLIWRGGRRVDSWTGGRKARFTLTALVFLAYAVLLAFWGALEPWSR
ncbi:MAG: beta-lactamase family protein [Caulobacteraceae bacterium]|nr:beta-lactamase family protein [Caulobacteraceae bacterium]